MTLVVSAHAEKRHETILAAADPITTDSNRRRNFPSGPYGSKGAFIGLVCTGRQGQHCLRATPKRGIIRTSTRGSREPINQGQAVAGAPRVRTWRATPARDMRT